MPWNNETEASLLHVIGVCQNKRKNGYGTGSGLSLSTIPAVCLSYKYVMQAPINSSQRCNINTCGTFR